ncbi:MAG: MCP four helix bundle domain-containing protein [Saprospiraceae bacterium]|nr:MCP four helix bundle domain-containing protein [Saprospiraceae bacterium]
MSRFITSKNRTKVAILLSSVLVLILLAKVYDRYNYKKLEASFHSIYQDRLMAESYLFNLYDKLKTKQDIFQIKGYENINNEKVQAELEVLNGEMNSVIALYEETYLTLEEDIQFFKFKNLHEILFDIEGQLAFNNINDNESLHQKHGDLTLQAFDALAKLSTIQTKEGQLIKSDFDKTLLSGQSNLILEITLLVIIGLLIVGIISSTRFLAFNPERSAKWN